MQRARKNRVFGALVVSLLVGMPAVSVGEAPPVPTRTLDNKQQQKVRQLESQLQKALGEGKFAQAVETAREIASLRERWQGEKYGESVAARELVTRYQALLRLPEKDQQEVAKSFRAESEADALESQRKYKAAADLHRQALAIRIKVLGEEHPDTATSYNKLAGNLNVQGQHAEAQALCEKALAIWRKVLGEEHPDTAACYSNLAANLFGQSKPAEAQALCEKALAIKRKVLGEEHPDTAESYSDLAVCLGAQGKFAEAQALCEKALAIRRQVQGEEHPGTATSYNNLAMSLNAQGKYAEAQPLLEKALAIRRKVLGEEHPETAGSYNNVAYNLDAQGRYAEALPLFEKALALRIKVLGEEHSDTATSYNNVASNLDAQGKHAEAQPLYEKALAIRRKAWSVEHPETAGSYNNFAYNLQAQGKYAEAQPLYEKALAICRHVLGEEHPFTAFSYSNVAANLDAQAKHAEAQPLYEKALAIRRKALSEEHPLTAGSYCNAAVNLWQQNKIGEAVRLLQASLPGQEAARFQTAPSGFDRAVAASQGAAPHVLLALGLAHLKHPADAFRHAEASLARGLLDDLTTGSVDEARQAVTLRARLDRFDRQLLPLFGRVTLSDDQKALREALGRQRRETLSQLARLAAEVSTRQLLPLADIQKQLPDDSALVLWLDSDKVGEHHACVVRSRGDPAWVRLAGSGTDGAWTAEDRELANRLYRLLEQPTPQDAERQRLSDALRQQRLEPVRKHLDARGALPAVRRLLVVPTGWAGLVPLEVLSSDYRLSYVPSGSVFSRLQQQHRSLDGSSLLALGDPAFQASEVRRPEPPAQGLLLSFVQPGGNASRAGLHSGDVLLAMGGMPLTSLADLKKALAEGGAVRYWRDGKEQMVKVPAGALGVRVDERPALQAVAAWRAAEASPVTRGPDPVALPGTRWEVQTLSRLVPKTTTLLGSEASEQRLDELARDGKLKEYRLLHLATHGVVDCQTPQRSRLLLARDRLPDLKDTPPGKKPYTGQLTVGDIRQGWRLDADLVVLSACQTALGRESKGDGLLGFAQAFLQCGAHCVVLSRWEAEDTATALLMLRFYENLLGKRKDLKQPLGRAEALEEAKRWLRELPRRDVEALAAALHGGKLSDTTTRGSVVELNPKERPVKLPQGERPYAHPFFWATFVLVGDPD
jgi:CHAT domain-containing protein/tetratricopeptide (TPR) repeat protein